MTNIETPVENNQKTAGTPLQRELFRCRFFWCIDVGARSTVGMIIGNDLVNVLVALIMQEQLSHYISFFDSSSFAPVAIFLFAILFGSLGNLVGFRLPLITRLAIVTRFVCYALILGGCLAFAFVEGSYHTTDCLISLACFALQCLVPLASTKILVRAFRALNYESGCLGDEPGEVEHFVTIQAKNIGRQSPPVIQSTADEENQNDIDAEDGIDQKYQIA